ncbi:hypothetical protein [Thioalkalivibrio sp. ALE23]|uniref:hypothetical protein n=1 Tax=Thioalkalivibrio sp. ALE23 TaxID=1265495 RepID=UPI0012DEB5C4|nr:hypothetical protein [Thioalkalivibrio sp. ALE23]
MSEDDHGGIKLKFLIHTTEDADGYPTLLQTDEEQLSPAGKLTEEERIVLGRLPVQELPDNRGKAIVLDADTEDPEPLIGPRDGTSSLPEKPQFSEANEEAAMLLINHHVVRLRELRAFTWQHYERIPAAIQKLDLNQARKAPDLETIVRAACNKEELVANQAAIDDLVEDSRVQEEVEKKMQDANQQDPAPQNNTESRDGTEKLLEWASREGSERVRLAVEMKVGDYQAMAQEAFIRTHAPEGFRPGRPEGTPKKRPRLQDLQALKALRDRTAQEPDGALREASLVYQPSQDEEEPMPEEDARAYDPGSPEEMPESGKTFLEVQVCAPDGSHCWFMAEVDDLHHQGDHEPMGENREAA